MPEAEHFMAIMPSHYMQLSAFNGSNKTIPVGPALCYFITKMISAQLMSFGPD
jgi:hypothetical protein